MKGTLLLAEAATVHQDGTISILRAWIGTALYPGPPFVFRGMLVVRIEADRTDGGANHRFDLRCIDEDGHPAMPDVQGQFAVRDGGGLSNMLLGVATVFPKPGRFTFVLRVNNNTLDTYALNIVQGNPVEEAKQ